MTDKTGWSPPPIEVPVPPGSDMADSPKLNALRQTAMAVIGQSTESQNGPTESATRPQQWEETPATRTERSAAVSQTEAPHTVASVVRTLEFFRGRRSLSPSLLERERTRLNRRRPRPYRVDEPLSPNPQAIVPNVRQWTEEEEAA